MTSEAVRVGYMAGREIAVPEIARQLRLSSGQIRSMLLAAGVKLPQDRGPVIFVTVPVEAFLNDIDGVGRRYRMSRDQVAHAILTSVLRGGAARIEDALERGGIPGV